MQGEASPSRASEVAAMCVKSVPAPGESAADGFGSSTGREWQSKRDAHHSEEFKNHLITHER